MDKKTPTAKTAETVYPVPEPDLTPDEMIARARAMRDAVRADSDAAEERGTYSEELHEAFLKAGFYRIVQPRMFGGYEFTHTTFYRTMLEIARGDPGISWCLTLAASHPWLIGSHWSEEAQRELFGPDGHFAAPHRPIPGGTVTPVDGGYVVDGLWDYCSGIPYSTHFIGGAKVEDGADPPSFVNVVVPKGQVEVLDDWSGDVTLGMRASGSNSVRVDKVTVPAHYVAAAVGRETGAEPGWPGTPGTRLHGNPMYLGQLAGPYHMSLVVPVVGAARAALDEFEVILKTRKTRFPPIVPRAEEVNCQRAYGAATALADAAEAILVRATEIYRELCERWAADGTPITKEDNVRLWAMVQQGGRLGVEAVGEVFDASSSAAAKKGQRIQRYMRDVAMYRSHISSQRPTFFSMVARAHFGLEVGGFGF